MKIKFVNILFIVTVISCSASHAQSDFNNNFYIGFGTGVSSYLGGYFGKAYSMKVLSDYDDDYYYDGYYSSYSNPTLWSPIQFDVVSGFTAEFSSTFIFAFNGSVDPEFVTGSSGDRDYIDRNSYSQMFAMPVSATLNFHSSEEYGGGYFFKFGPAFQYTSEEYDRIREYYRYEKFNSYSSFAHLNTVSKTKWIPGFTVSTGIQMDLGDGMSSFTELSYSYFKISGDNSTALALDRAKEAQLFALNTRIYFGF